jgi:fatty acid desaturase
MVFREPETWRWSHARHHSDTIIVGRDAEIAFKRNVPFYKFVLELFSFGAFPAELKQWIQNAFGKITNNQKDFQPPETFRISKWASRVYLSILIATVVFSWRIGSFEPMMFIGLPSIYGHWFVVTLGVTQHAGLAENTTDHRLNTRTIYMGPLNRWIYWNMNYHVEHHIYPSVPFHQLKNLHEAVKDQLAPPYKSTLSALREVVYALRRQAKDENFYIQRQLPTTVN